MHLTCGFLSTHTHTYKHQWSELNQFLKWKINRHETHEVKVSQKLRSFYQTFSLPLRLWLLDNKMALITGYFGLADQDASDNQICRKATVLTICVEIISNTLMLNRMSFDQSNNWKWTKGNKIIVGSRDSKKKKKLMKIHFIHSFCPMLFTVLFH